jgi:hypothetical protein
MMGVAQTTLLLLCSSRLARWLLSIGLVLTASGLVAMIAGADSVALPLFVVALIIGVPAAVISPVLLGPVIFRSFCAPRSVGLIPGGRLKLVGGALTTQLLLALFIGGVVAAMLAHPFAIHTAAAGSGRAQVAAIIIIAFGLLTANFIGYYWASKYRFGGLWFFGLVPAALLFGTAQREWRLSIPLSTATGLSAMLVISVLAWACFAIVCVRAPLIRPPNNNTGMGSSSSRPTGHGKDFAFRGLLAFTKSEAIGILLSGTPRYRLSTFSRALLGLLFFLIVMAVTTGIHAFSRNWLNWGGLLCLLTGPVAWGNSSRLAARSKLLWMPSGLDRSELFRQIETKNWQVVFGFCALGIVFAATWFGLSIGSGHVVVPFFAATWAVAVVVTPLASGAMCMYCGLQYVRGRRLADMLVVAGCLAVWLIEMICVVAGAGMQAITTLLAIQIILAAPLRLLALRRWQTRLSDQNRSSPVSDPSARVTPCRCNQSRASCASPSNQARVFPSRKL